MNDLKQIKKRVRRKLGEFSNIKSEDEAMHALKGAIELAEEYRPDKTGFQFESVSVTSARPNMLFAIVAAEVYGCHRHWKLENRETVFTNVTLDCFGSRQYPNPENLEIVFTGEPLDVLMAVETYRYLLKSMERITRKTIRNTASHEFKRYFKKRLEDSLHIGLIGLAQKSAWEERREAKLDAVTEYEKSVPFNTFRIKKVRG
jgi:hypothetical protein